MLVERFQTIPGVSSVNINGEKNYAMRIWLDPAKLSAYNLTALDVQSALSRENVELPSGKITGDATELTVRTFGRLFTEEEFNNVIVKSDVAAGNIRVRDVGQAVLGPENEESILRESRVPMIAIGIIPLPGANYVSISDEFFKRLEQIKTEIPADITLDVSTDQTKYIKRSISEVQETLLISFGLVVLIIYLFFRDFLIAIRPLIDIPVSLIATFFIMYLCGFSINVLTMLGIVLATGLVVDDGIVVTENIYKKLEGGMNKYRAAKEGSREIFFAVVSTSITLAVVFLPVVFLPGFVGRLFREFGIVVAGAVLISAFVSLTLTPVLSVKLTRSNHSHSWFYRVTGAVLRRDGIVVCTPSCSLYAPSLDGVPYSGGCYWINVSYCNQHTGRTRTYRRQEPVQADGYGTRGHIVRLHGRLHGPYHQGGDGLGARIHNRYFEYCRWSWGWRGRCQQRVHPRKSRRAERSETLAGKDRE